MLIKEEEVVSEDMRSKPAPAVQPGDRAFQKHISKPSMPAYLHIVYIAATVTVLVLLLLLLYTAVSYIINVAYFSISDLWDTYLCPEWVDPSRKR